MVISQKLSINEILDGQKLVSAKGCRIFKPDSISSLKFMPYLKHFVCSFPLNIFYNPSDATSKQLVNIRPKKTISVWVYQRKNTCQGFFIFYFIFFFFFCFFSAFIFVFLFFLVSMVHVPLFKKCCFQLFCVIQKITIHFKLCVPESLRSLDT